MGWKLVVSLILRTWNSHGQRCQCVTLEIVHNWQLDRQKINNYTLERLLVTVKMHEFHAKCLTLDSCEWGFGSGRRGNKLAKIYYTEIRTPIISVY